MFILYKSLYILDFKGIPTFFMGFIYTWDLQLRLYIININSKVHSSSDEDPYSLTQSGSSGYSAGAYPGTRDPSLYPTVRVQVTRQIDTIRSIDRKKDGQIDINVDRKLERQTSQWTNIQAN